MFCVDLRTNSDYFPIQHELTGFYNLRFRVFTARYGLDMCIVWVKYISLQCTPSFWNPTTQPQRSVSSLCFVLLHCPHLTFFTSERPTLLPAYLYHKDKRVLPRNLQSTFTRVTCLSETGADLSCTDDSEMPVAVTPDRLFLASLKMKVQFYAGTVRDCWCVGQTDLKEKKKRKAEEEGGCTL